MRRGRGQGRGGPRLRQGGPTSCVCTNCGYTSRKTKGVPCAGQRCPKCKSPMVGNW